MIFVGTKKLSIVIIELRCRIKLNFHPWSMSKIFKCSIDIMTIKGIGYLIEDFIGKIFKETITIQEYRENEIKTEYFVAYLLTSENSSTKKREGYLMIC